MTLRRSESLPNRLRNTVNGKTNHPEPRIPESNTVPDHIDTPVREEVVAAWKSLHTDVKSIKNDLQKTESPNHETSQPIKHSPRPNNNRNVRNKITYDDKISSREADRCSSFPLDQRGVLERGPTEARRRTLLQRLLSWKTPECDCPERYTPKLRPEDLLCTCGSTVARVPTAVKGTQFTDRARSKSVGYEAAQDVKQFRRCASAGPTVGAGAPAALRARAALTLARRYYPEGGWGWTITVVGTLVQVISHGLQMGGGSGAIACTAAVRFKVPPLYTHGLYVLLFCIPRGSYNPLIPFGYGTLKKELWPRKFLSYVLRVPAELRKVLLAKDYWPEGIIYRRFREARPPPRKIPSY